MPRAVKTWIEEKDFELVERVQKGILEAYERDFSKHTDNSTATKIQYVWNSIPSQLAKENIKFNNKILNIPLYAIWNTENYIEEIN